MKKIVHSDEEGVEEKVMVETERFKNLRSRYNYNTSQKVGRDGKKWSEDRSFFLGPKITVG